MLSPGRQARDRVDATIVAGVAVSNRMSVSAPVMPSAVAINVRSSQRSRIGSCEVLACGVFAGRRMRTSSPATLPRVKYSYQLFLVQ
jgi:hypothetical protein